MRNLIIQISSVLVLLLASSCNSVAPTTVAFTPTPIYTPTTTNTPTATHTPTATFTPTPTLTPTLLPKEMVDQILRTHNAIVWIYAETALMNQTASNIQSKSISGFEAFGAILLSAGIISATNGLVPEIVPPELLADYWKKSVDTHEQNKFLMRKWLNKEIESSQVVSESQPLLATMETTVEDMQQLIVYDYHIAPDLLQEQYKKMIDSLESIGATPTATPAPKKP